MIAGSGSHSGSFTQDFGISIVGFHHTPVLLKEILSFVPSNAKTVIDFTLGGGNHAFALLEQFPDAFLYGIDRDSYAIDAARERLYPFRHRIETLNAPFSQAFRDLRQKGVQADFMLADLGVSSYQLDADNRGFSFRHEGPLDMRMDPGQRETAADIINGYSEQELVRIIRQYGEERFAQRIAQRIVDQRKQKAFCTTLELTACVLDSIPKKFQFGKVHPATKTFQAIRIQVNREIEELRQLLDQALDLLHSGGRLAVISFHSLEDRPVKQRFKHWENPCQCPKEFPICVCGKTAMAKVITKKAVTASTDEKEKNARSRSAKLRVVEKR